MPNTYRGEIEAVLDGKRYTLCLTLGALAELEHAFGAQDMMGLATRFESGRISSLDCLKIIGCGLRGAGHSIDDVDLSQMRADNGAAGFVEIVARLLTATFGGASQKSKAGKGGDPGPFPGTAS
jgi:Phage tail tube protein, GTA-gp10